MATKVTKNVVSDDLKFAEKRCVPLRLSIKAVKMLDGLKAHFGLNNRTLIVELAIRKMFKDEGLT